MKLRVIKNSENDYIPQWFDEHERYGGMWKDVRYENGLPWVSYTSLTDAQHACYEFEEQHKEDSNVVWETEII